VLFLEGFVVRILFKDELKMSVIGHNNSGNFFCFSFTWPCYLLVNFGTCAAALSVLSFVSVLMTYFGVNYYLSGLHSYAAGDPVPIPTFVYYTIAILIIILALAFYKQSKLKQLVSQEE